ncbi:MAG: hypothetical protein KIPDCIKN_02991 [Haliscomenobacter sp.]|nr:hypothetical protein [Haliscomenobacter sp.]
MTATFLLHSCTCSELTTNAVTVMYDQTDTLNYRKFQERAGKDFQEIAGKLFPVAPCSEGVFRLLPVNGIGSNEVQTLEYQIPDASINEYHLPAEHQLFIQEMGELAKDLSGPTPAELPNTLIFEPLCRELHLLVSLPGPANRFLILSSDLLEHSASIDMYRDSTEPEDLLSRMEQAYGCQLPENLEGIEIRIVTHRLEATDEAMRRASQFWEFVLRERGANVIVSSSLTI